MHNRRRFIKTSTLVSLAPVLPTFLSKAAIGRETAKNNGRILVVIQLDGGNDGINTIVPYKDEGYAEHRKELRLPEKDLLKVHDDFAFHPRLKSASELFEGGRISVIHGVGYPNPNRSHFESMAIWHAGNTNAESRNDGNGWIGEAVSARPLSSGPHAIHIGDETLPVALRGRRCNAATVSNAADLQMRLSIDAQETDGIRKDTAPTASLTDFLTRTVSDAYVSAQTLAASTKSDATARYPNSNLGQRLKLVSQMIKSGAAAKVYYTSQGGYDTHAVQLPAHGNLLGELSSSLKAFMNDLKESKLEDRVLVMAFSEFGRRVTENASYGTDHGTAGPILLAGKKLVTRSFGTLPKLTNLEGGDLKHTIDFRDVYATVLSDWLGFHRPNSMQNFGSLKLFEV